jgi:hypothetical protein
MLKEITEILDQYGWVTLALVLSATLLVRYLLTKWNVWLQRDKENSESKGSEALMELTHNEFFSNSDFFINNEIPMLKFVTPDGGDIPVRQKMYRQILAFYFKSVRDACKSLIEEEVDSFTTSQWSTLVNAKLVRAQEEFEAWCTEDGIPDVAIKKFSLWKSTTEQIMRNYIMSLAFSTVYVNNSARTNTFLYLMNLLMVTTVADAERTLVGMNGELAGLTYKNEALE